MSVAGDYVEKLLSTLGDITNKYDENYEQIKKLEGETQDLLHKLEFNERLRLYEGFYIAKRLHEIRKIRRQLKNENETLFYLYDMINKNPQFKNTFIKVQGDIKKKLKDIGERKYRPKVLVEVNNS